MTLADVLEFQTLEEAQDALKQDIAEFNEKATRARELGAMHQNQICHGHIDEDLELLVAIWAAEDLEAHVLLELPT